MAIPGIGSQFYTAFVTVQDDHDRTEFLRDAAAALRVGHPRAARAFLARLCRRRAWVELHQEQRGRRITQADVNHMHSGRASELLRLCEECGFFETRLTHVEVKHTYEPK